MKGKIFALQTTEIAENQVSGAGDQHVLVIISENESADKTLGDLLKAIKLDPEKDTVTLYLRDGQQSNISSLIHHYGITKVIAFGFNSIDIGYNLNQAYYHNYQFGDHSIIFSESLKELQADKNKKIALWKTLQSVYLV